MGAIKAAVDGHGAIGKRLADAVALQQLMPAQLSQHPDVDPVGPAGQGRQPLHPSRVGDLDIVL